VVRRRTGLLRGTVIADETFGREPETVWDAEGREWRRVASYTSSGEAECPLSNKPVGEQDEGAPCPLCEADAGESTSVTVGVKSSRVPWRK